MFIQRSSQTNPYAAYQALVERRALYGDRHRALAEPELRFGQLTAPALKAQFLAHAGRYERLGNTLSGLMPRLAELTRASSELLQATPSPFASAAARATPSEASEAPQGRGLGPELPAAEGGTPARPARLTGNASIGLRPGSAETTARMEGMAPEIRTDAASPATPATLTLGKVALSTAGSTTASLDGGNIRLSFFGGTTDFGKVTINGVTTTIGSVATRDVSTAARFIADRINGNEDNPVTASVDSKGKSLILTAKTPGSAGNITINQVSSDSDGSFWNFGSIGFRSGDSATGQDGTSDFGSVKINGVTTTFGTRSNAGLTPRSAAQWMAERLNANAANDFTAAAGGPDGDQLVLTSKTIGSQSKLRISQVNANSDGNSKNNATTGFVSGLSAQGQDASPGVSDYGSVTINGVTTTFGTLANAGQTSQSVARFMVDRLNANSENAVVASLGGPAGDRVVLTAKTPGSAGSFRIDAVSSDSDGRPEDDAFNGWTVGREALGSDAASGKTDFGAITVNGITTQLGVLDGQEQTPQSALQLLVDRLNQTNPTLAARAEDGRIVLQSKEQGSGAGLSIDAVVSDSDGDPSNDGDLGFVAGLEAQGEDARPGERAAAPSGTRDVPRRADPEAVTRVVNNTDQFIRDLNEYLQSLQEASADMPRSLRGFGRELTRILQDEDGSFGRLGLQFKDDRLELDGKTLKSALEADPVGTSGAFDRLERALEESVGAQVFALDHMRSALQSSSETAGSLGQVAASIYKIEHRQQKLSWLLEQVTPSEESLRQQRERLEKLREDERKAEAETAEAEQDPMKGADTAIAPDAEREGFGLRRSPVPESFLEAFQATRESGPRWPFER